MKVNNFQKKSQDAPLDAYNAVLTILPKIFRSKSRNVSLKVRKNYKIINYSIFFNQNVSVDK